MPALSGPADSSAAGPGPPRATLKRVGHKGADAIAPGNTLQSLDAALAAGVDMIEFDVIPQRGSGRLVLAHDHEAAALREPLPLEDALAHLAAERFAAIELDVDLKAPGYEERVVAAIREHGLIGRTLVSSHHLQSLARVRGAEPGLRLGWSVPRVSRDYLRSPVLAGPAFALLQVMRRALPGRAATMLAAGRCEAIMAHWRLVSRRLAGAVRAAGGELYVWTVDDAARIAFLEALGVTGVITNDPRLFAARASVCDVDGMALEAS